MQIDRRAAWVLVAVLAPLGVLASGCVSDDNSGPTANPDSGLTVGDSGTQPSYDGGSPDSTVPDSSVPYDANSPGFDAYQPPVAHVRLADFADPNVNIVPGFKRGRLKPADSSSAGSYDVCVAPHGTGNWQGPLLAAVGAAPITAGEVTKYFDVPPGQYDVRVVPVSSLSQTLDDGGTAPPAAPSCAAIASEDGGTLFTDITDLPALAAGQAVTAIAMPDLGANAFSLAVTALVDELTPVPGMVNVRFANVSTGIDEDPLSLVLGGGDLYSPIISNVSGTLAPEAEDAGPDAAIAQPIDSNGYTTIAPFTNVDLSISDLSFSPPDDVAYSPALTLTSGQSVSAFAVATQPGSFPLVGIIVCIDGETNPVNPFLSNCTPVGSLSGGVSWPEVRFGDFVADSPETVGFCAQYQGQPTFTWLGPNDTVSQAGMTRRYDLQPGFQYTVRIIDGASTDCSNPIGPDMSYTPPTGTSEGATIVYTGFIAAPDGGDPAVDDAGPPPAEDGGGAWTSPLATTSISPVFFNDVGCSESAPSARIVNVNAVNPAPTSVTFYGDGSFAAYPTPYGASWGQDACGYSSLSSVEGGQYLGVVPSSNSFYSFQANEGTLSTLYVFQEPSSASVTVVDCADTDFESDACSVLGNYAP